MYTESQNNSQSWFNPLHPNIIMYILHTFADKENLYNNQELLWLLIISYVLITLMCDSGGYFEEKLKASHSLRSES